MRPERQHVLTQTQDLKPTMRYKTGTNPIRVITTHRVFESSANFDIAVAGIDAPPWPLRPAGKCQFEP